MNIPKKIKIGPFWYSVELSQDITRASGDAFGSIHHASNKIFIDPNACEQQKEETFIHEVLHACVFITGLSHRFNAKTKDETPTEEQTVTELSTVLYGVFLDNPDVFGPKSTKTTPGRASVMPQNRSKKD
jgi:hypothetical protein